MGTRKYKCYYCKKLIENNNELLEITYGKNNNIRRVHKSCYDFLEKEKNELDSLIEYIKKIYNIEIIPSSFYIRLQDIRNGNDTYNKVKKSKKGYRYKLVEYTYKKNLKEIQRTLPNIKGDTNSQLLYGLAIVRNNINDVVKDLKAKQKRKKELDKIKNETIVTHIEQEIKVDTTKKKKPTYDWL